MKRFSLRRFPALLIFSLTALLGVAGHFAPAQAQAASPAPSRSVFTPAPPAPPIVFTPISAPSSAQVASLNTLIATQNTQIAALNAKLLAAITPTVAWQPYVSPWTDGTHLVVEHYMVALTLGTIPNTGGNSPPAYSAFKVANYEEEMREGQARGVDIWALDAADFSTDTEHDKYAQNFRDIFTAADAVGFKVFFCVDFSNADLEKPAGIASIEASLALYAGRPSYFHFQGKPFLSCYAGDGGGVPIIKQVYPPFLANLKASDLSPYFVPGWGDVAELAAVNADGGWTFSSLSSPLQSLSPLPAIETLAAQVQAAKTAQGVPLTWMQPITFRAWNQASGDYEEYEGGRGAAVQYDSSFYSQHPTWIEGQTDNDVGDGSPATSLAANTIWNGLPNYNVPGFWPTQAGFQHELSYYNQRFKTGQTPLIQTDTVIIYNSPQFVAGGSATGYFTAFLAHTDFVRVSGVGPQQSFFEPAGVTHGSFQVTQAGTPLAEIMQNGQVTKQVSGQPITAVSSLTNRNVFSFYSVPGVSFTLSVPVPSPALPVDRAGIMVRSTSIANKAVGVKNFAVYDEAATPETMFVQNSMNDPAVNTLAQNFLASSTLTGQDVLGQYNGYAYVGLFPDPLDPAQSPLAYPQYYPNDNSVNRVDKPLPSGSVHLRCQAVSTNADPNADGQGGLALVCSTGDTYNGRGYLAVISKYAGVWMLTIKAEDNITSDSNSAGPVILGSLPVNTPAPGETYILDLYYDGKTLRAVATPGNQQK